MPIEVDLQFANGLFGLFGLCPSKSIWGYLGYLGYALANRSAPAQLRLGLGFGAIWAIWAMPF